MAKTFAHAIESIGKWDRETRSAPLLSEQMRIMKDGEQTWSVTHNWESVRETLVRIGLAEELASVNQNGWNIPVTRITDLGREVRSFYQAK